VTETENRADALFRALADRTRRDILRLVPAGEQE
jgi:DNA-binding transcriptional ArsR family regulator